MSSHIPFTALCISGISTTTIGMYTQAMRASSKPEDLRAKKRAQISHAESARNEAQKTYWTGDVGHPKAGVSGGGTGGAVLDQAQGVRIPGLTRAPRLPIRSPIKTLQGAAPEMGSRNGKENVGRPQENNAHTLCQPSSGLPQPNGLPAFGSGLPQPAGLLPA